MRMIVILGYLKPVGRMVLSVLNVEEKSIGRFLPKICINAQIVVIEFLLQQELFSIKQELP